MDAPLTLRLATLDDVPGLNLLIDASARQLSEGFYTERQIEAAVRYVFGVDTNLIADGTYFVAHVGAELVGCGGWSWRRTMYGGDQRRVGDVDRLDPAVDAARIRAFFVAPAWARRGVGTAVLQACTDAARKAGFRQLELMATLPGVPLYAARGFLPVEEVRDVLPDGTEIQWVRMRRPLDLGPA
ncbi:MAG: GNAT family N-acetyltransferase [Gemmatimonadaceae bacterium]